MGKKKLKSSPFLMNAVLMAAIAGCIVLAYWGLHQHEFLNFDDDLYVQSNQHIRNGLSWQNFKWAFGFNDKCYWHPLTWLSLMLDCHLFGHKPGPLLLGNLVWHILNALLLFLILLKMTGARGKSAVAALFFALHPLNVESVSWMVERKAVLSGFFLLSALYAYVFYTQKKNHWLYGLVLALFALGLMAKPVIIVFPLLLLALDYWPLARFKIPAAGGGTASKLRGWLREFAAFFRLNSRIIIWEKLPLYALSMISVFISMLSLMEEGGVVHYKVIPFYLRVANFFTSILEYLRLIFWPVELSIYYPFPQQIVPMYFLAALLFAVGATVVAFYLRKQRPWLLAGWCWFIVALLPVSGLIQAGLWPAFSCRFMYLPLMGFFILLVWEVDERLKGRYADFLKIVLCVAAVIYLAFLTRIQNTYYSNSYSLFKRSLEVVKDNALALNNIAVHFGYLGRHDDAMKYLERGIKLYPKSPGFYHNYGASLVAKEEDEKAVFYFQQAVKLDPKYYKAYVSLAMIRSRQGDNKEALQFLDKAREIEPDDFGVRISYSDILAKQGRHDEAISHLIFVLDKDSRHIPARLHLAQIYQERGLHKEALAQYDILDKTVPDKKGFVYYKMAGVYAQRKNYEESRRLLEKALNDGFDVFDLLSKDKDFKNFRGTAYYRQLLEKRKK
ncbi:MAG TPA: tetratricopeptide repeat protein [Smithellaceae bacterium]|nr:tetratricopeptide repeat protein [Smithellaceae bacterium]